MIAWFPKAWRFRGAASMEGYLDDLWNSSLRLLEPDERKRAGLLKDEVMDEKMRELAAYERQEILYHCVRRFEERHEELAQTLCIEAGKPIRDSRGEATRLIDTFRIAAEEAVRITGEVLPLDITARARGYPGMCIRIF